METDVEAAAMDSDQMSDAEWICGFWQQNAEFYENDLSQLFAKLDPELVNAVAAVLESEAATMVTERFVKINSEDSVFVLHLTGKINMRSLTSLEVDRGGGGGGNNARDASQQTRILTLPMS